MEEKVFERDWRFMLDAVLRINSVESVELLEKEALECLCLLIPCTQGTIFVVEESNGVIPRYGRPYAVGMEALFFDEFLNGDYNSDPIFTGTNIPRQTETFRDGDLLPEDYRVQTRLYREIYAKQGIHYALRSYLVHNARIVGNISLFNSKEAGEFSSKDVFIQTTLAPHIALKLGTLLALEDPQRSLRTAQQEKAIDGFGLTGREREIVLMIASDVDDREIADTLCISMGTLKKHIYNAYKKMRVNNRVQLYSLVNAHE